MSILFDRDLQPWDKLDVFRPEQFLDRSPDHLDKYTVAPGDAVPGMSGERAEGKAYTDGDPGDRHRWTWQTRFPLDFQPNPESLWNFWAQWHAASSVLQAPIALTVRTYDDVPSLKMRVWPGGERYYDLGPVSKGVSSDWRADIVWGDANGGSIVIIRDGFIVARDSGPNCYTGDSGTYFKQGFYRAPSALTTSIFHGHARCVTF